MPPKANRTGKTPAAAPQKRWQQRGAIVDNSSDEEAAAVEESISAADAGSTVSLNATPNAAPISQDAFWKSMITQEDMETLNLAAEDEQQFRTVSRHFWNRAFLFHRRWNAADQRFVYDQILRNIHVRDRPRLKMLSEEALFEVEETYNTTVRQFATYWLENTPMGQQYVRKYANFKKKKKPSLAPKPEPPAIGSDLLTRQDGPHGFEWNRAISTRFWRRSLVSVHTAKPTQLGAIAWLDEDFETMNSGQALWINALDGVALELVRRAVPLLVQGKDRMSRDVHRSHFATVQFPAVFCHRAVTSPTLRAVVRNKSRQSMQSISPDGSKLIDRQHCSSTWPHRMDEDDGGNTNTEEQRVLEPGPDFIQQMLDFIKEDVDVTGEKKAKATEEAIEQSFRERAAKIPNSASAITMAPLGILDPRVSNTPYVNELGDMYGKANIFGRCDIHRAVLQTEMLRLQEYAQVMMQRVQSIKDEIALHDQNSATADTWWHVAQDTYKQYEALQQESLAKKNQSSAHGDGIGGLRKRDLSGAIGMEGLGRPTKSAKMDSSHFSSTAPGSFAPSGSGSTPGSATMSSFSATFPTSFSAPAAASVARRPNIASTPSTTPVSAAPVSTSSFKNSTHYPRSNDTTGHDDTSASTYAPSAHGSSIHSPPGVLGMQGLLGFSGLPKPSSPQVVINPDKQTMSPFHASAGEVLGSAPLSLAAESSHPGNPQAAGKKRSSLSTANGGQNSSGAKDHDLGAGEAGATTAEDVMGGEESQEL